MTLELVKVEKGLCAGDVLYHRHMEKTAEEVAQIKADKAAAAVRAPLRPLLWSFLSCRLRPVLSFARAGCVWSCCSRFSVALSGTPEPASGATCSGSLALCLSCAEMWM